MWIFDTNMNERQILFKKSQWRVQSAAFDLPAAEEM
jgi:hypothetical protein